MTDSTNSATPIPVVEGACTDGIDYDRDGKLDCADPDCTSPGGEGVPAPPLDRTVATTVSESAAYLYQGDNPAGPSSSRRLERADSTAPFLASNATRAATLMLTLKHQATIFGPTLRVLTQ